MLSLNVRTPVHENNHTSHRVQDPSLIRISQHQLHCEREGPGGAVKMELSCEYGGSVTRTAVEQHNR